MQNQFVVRTKDNRMLCFFYNENRGVTLKEMREGRESAGRVIVNNVREPYTVNLCDNGDIFIFCQSIDGDIILLRGKDDKWNQNVILKNNGRNVQNIIFNAIIDENKMNLIYNVPADGKNVYTLMRQGFDGKGKWQEAVQIDRIAGMNDNIFHIQMLSGKHGILFYQKSGGENNIGYREITVDSIGKYNSVYSTTYRIGDSTFLTANDSIHFLFAVKNIFSSKIIYRKKEASGFSEPIVLGEGQQMGGCMMCIVKNRLYAFWTAGGRLYFCFSDDGGNSFSMASKYTRKFCLNPKRAYYLSFGRMNESEFLCRNIYTDSTNICDIQIMPDLYSDFYNNIFVGENKNSVDTVKVQNDFQEMQQNTPRSVTQNVGKHNMGMEMSELERLQNQISADRNRMAQKDMQIEQLTSVLRKKNEEIVAAENNWKGRYRAAAAEIDALKRRLEEAEQVKRNGIGGENVNSGLPREEEEPHEQV